MKASYLALLNKLPFTARRVLEVGGVHGLLASTYLRRNPSATYVFPTADKQLATQLKLVNAVAYQGAVESTRVMSLLKKHTPFDVLVLHVNGSDEAVLGERLALVAPLLSDEVTCVVALIDVRADVTQGAENTSLTVSQQPNETTDRQSHFRPRMKRLANTLLSAGWRMIDAQLSDVSVNHAGSQTRTDCIVRISRASQPAREVLSVATLGLKKVGGVTHARVDFPMAALRAEPYTRVVWDAEKIAIPKDMPPGILVLHRFAVNPTHPLLKSIEEYSRRGWIVVLDFDDDPRFWPEIVASKFYGFHAVHAVSVSTPALAHLVRAWNSELKVLPNAIFEIPDQKAETNYMEPGQRLRIFYGAFNREQDMAEVAPSLFSMFEQHADAIEIEVIFDKRFYEDLPTTISARFHPLVSFEQYQQLLASCDLALLPLRDTEFNRCKSDLKFIECCAAGVIPICSNVVYGLEEDHRTIGLFPASVDDWGKAIEALIADPKALQHKKKLARDYVLTKRLHAQGVSERETWYRSLLSRRAELEECRQRRVEALVNHA